MAALKEISDIFVILNHLETRNIKRIKFNSFYFFIAFIKWTLVMKMYVTIILTFLTISLTHKNKWIHSNG